MSGPSGERCAYCYYCADPGAADEYSGICLRYPHPTKDTHMDDRKVWVSLLSWCGEFKLHPSMSSHMWANIPHGTVHADEPSRKP